MIAVFDIDGVLADARHREHLVAGRPKDWDGFFAAVGDDPVLPAGRERLDAVPPADEIVLLSGRPERTRADTEAWLARNDLPWSRLLLRPDADRRPAARFKSDAIRAVGDPEAISVVVDDDAAVIAALAASGYSVEHFSAGEAIR